MESVFALVERVAPTDATVLIQGETGTGKELIARAIHTLSATLRPARWSRSIAQPSRSTCSRASCSATRRARSPGAIAQKIGRFELADRGTLFLDEVGDLPTALQPKLLRVLQEQELERLGGTQTLSRGRPCRGRDES